MLYDLWNCGKFIYAIYNVFRDESANNITRVKQCARSCGVVGTKMLQFLVMNEGFLSTHSRMALSDVYENCDTHSWEHTVATYANELGSNIYDDFIITENSKIPIGSGSIGQVYKLYDKEHSRFVALKVRHPGVDKHVNGFVRNVRLIIDTIEYFHILPCSVLLREFLCNIKNQLDFRIEAANTKELRRKFRNETTVIIPEIYTFTQNIIVMSYHDGVSFTDIKDPINQRRLSFHVFTFMLSAFITFDCMHCDLHYGNFKCQLDPCKIVVYDCGIIGKTKRLDVNKNIILAALSGDYMNLIGFLAHPRLEQQKNGKRLIDFYANSLRNSSDKTESEILGELIKKALLYGITIDTEILRVLQGLMMCMTITSVSVNHYNRLLCSGERSRDVIMVYLCEVCRRLDLHGAFVECMQSWIDEDPSIDENFYEWLQECHGHSDKSILIDSMMKLQFGQLNTVRHSLEKYEHAIE